MKFKLHAVREYRAPTIDNKEVLSDEKDIVVDAPSCCEAIVLAKKSLSEYLVTRWEPIEDKTQEVPENSCSEKKLEEDKSRKNNIELDPSQFKSGAEYRRMQHQMSEMSQEAAERIVKKHGFKVIS